VGSSGAFRLSPIAGPQSRHHGANLFAGMVEALTGIDDEVGAGAFFGVVHLIGQDGIQPRGVVARAG
jgi:hypothetical protein